VTKADLVGRLRAVLHAEGVETDEWGEAVLFLLTFYEEHQARAAAGAGEAA